MTVSATSTGSVTDGSVKTYDNLANSYGYDNTQTGMQGMLGIDNPKTSSINLLRAETAGNGSLNSRSATGIGYYWSSTKYTGTIYGYIMELSNGPGDYVWPNYYGRHRGASARCVSAS